MPNRIITAAVSGEKIKLSNRLAGASGSHNAVSLSMTFDSAWDGTTKKIYFFDRDGENAVYRLLTVDLLVNGAYIVPIPSEPLAKSGDMTITIRGVEMDGETAERIIMSASTTMKVDEAVTPDSDVAPIEPTPTQAEQLQRQIDYLIDEISGIPDSVQAAEESATAAAGSAIDADTARIAAEAARDDAQTARDAAENIVSDFDEHALAANAIIDGKVITATNAATAAQTAQGLSEGARDASIAAKNEAITAKTAAETAQSLAQTAKAGADTAKAGADAAKVGAESARDTAITAKDDAVTAKNDAQSAQTAAETAKGQAEIAKTGAETAATTAGNRALDSEAYGVGTRNGVAVGAGDPAYQNNAKWYKEQASEIVGGDFATKTEAQGWAEAAKAEAISTAAADAANKAGSALDSAMAYTDQQIAGIPSASGKRICRFVVGTSTAGWTAADCDYLCDGTADDVEIKAALSALPSEGGEVVILDGTYNIAASIRMNRKNVLLRGNGAATILKRMYASTDTSSGATARGMITIGNNKHIRVENLQIDGSKYSYTASYNLCIHLDYSDTCTISGVIFSHANTAIQANETMKCTLANNTFLDVSPNGVLLMNTSSCAISGNRFEDAYRGIVLWGSDRNAITGNTFSYTSYPQWRDIKLETHSSRNTVVGNICSGGSGEGEDAGIELDESSNNNLVIGNSTGNRILNAGTGNIVEPNL